MPTPSRRPLKPNPFISLRDPDTGKWRVVISFPTQPFQNKVFPDNGIGGQAFQSETPHQEA